MSNRKSGPKLAIVPESVMLRLSGEMADVLDQLEELQSTAAELKTRIADIVDAAADRWWHVKPCERCRHGILLGCAG